MKLIDLHNSLAFVHPELADEWDEVKNSGLTPKDVSFGSEKRIWWLCEKSHSYQREVYKKVKGKGCPYCAGRKVMPGWNCLASHDLSLAKQWHTDKNGDLTPLTVTPYSNKVVWWICEKGHEWQAQISKRSNGKGCPYCANQKVLKGFNDLAYKYPQLLIYWDYEKNSPHMPDEYVFGSDFKVWWKCSKEHSYNMKIRTKVSGAGCPVCSSQVLDISNCLATVSPELSKEWHPTLNASLTPYDLMANSHHRVWWHCEKGHEWKAAPYTRQVSGCPLCDSEKRTSFPEQTIAYYLSQHYKVINRKRVNGKELDVYIPSLNVGIEYDGHYYHDNIGSAAREQMKNAVMEKAGIQLLHVKESLHEEKVEGKYIYCIYNQNYNFLNFVMLSIAQILFETMGLSITFDVDIGRDRRKIEEQYIVSEKLNSIGVKCPLAASKWDYNKNGNITPEMVPFKSKKRYWWKCNNCGNEWFGAIENVTNSQYCANCVHAYSLTSTATEMEVISNEYSLASVNPALAAEWHPSNNGGLTPYEVTPGSNKKVWWRCSKCGHDWYAVIKSRNQGRGCKKCARVKILGDALKKHGSLGELHPELIKQWDNEKNLDVTIFEIGKSTRGIFWWKCQNGHSYQSSPYNKAQNPGCPVCSGKRVDPSNCLATVDEPLASFWDFDKNTEVKPTELTPGSRREVWWKCPMCGLSFQRRVYSMHQRRRCKYCSFKV